MLRDPIYEQSIQSHVAKTVRLLDDNAPLIDKAGDMSNEMLAVERCLQVLIEALVGVCRYVSKTEFEYKADNAGDAVSYLVRKAALDQGDANILMKVIGFRNALVHDYLDTNKNIVRAIMANKDYLFVQKTITALLNFR